MYIKFFFLGFLGFGLFSCQKFDDFKTNDSTSSPEGYFIKSSVLPSEIEDIKILAPQIVVNIGDVYANAKYLFIGEKNKGVHIFKNPQSASPQQFGYIQIPAMRHFDIQSSFLVADNGNDLISYRISGLDSLDFNSTKNGGVIKNTNNFGLSARKAGLFVYPNFPENRNIYFECPDSLKLVTEWEKRTIGAKVLNCYR